MRAVFRLLPAFAALFTLACEEGTVFVDQPSTPQNLTYRLEPSGNPDEPAGITLTWDPAFDPAAWYNLYRGDLQTLKQTGIYVQDPSSVPGARTQCNLTAPAAADSDPPASGQAYYFLAVVRKMSEEGEGDALVRDYDAAR